MRILLTRTRASALPTALLRNRALAVVLLAAALMLLPSAASAITISGTAQSDEAGTAWAGCDGISQNIKLRLSGGSAQTTSCNPVTGAWSFAGQTVGSEMTVTAYLDIPGSTGYGVLWYRTPATGSNITGLKVVEDVAAFQSTTGSNYGSLGTIADWTSYEDADVGYNTILRQALFPHKQVLIRSLAGGTLTSLHGVSTGMIRVMSGATFKLGSIGGTVLTAAGTSTDCTLGPNVSIPLCVDGGGSLTFATTRTRVTFIPSSSNSSVSVPAYNYDELNLCGASFEMGTGAAQSMTIRRLHVSGPVCPSHSTAVSFKNAPTLTVSERMVVGPNAALSSTAAMTWTLKSGIVGTGKIYLPNTDILLRTDDGLGVMSSGDRNASGTGDKQWIFRSIEFSNGSSYTTFGTAGAATWDSTTGAEAAYDAAFVPGSYANTTNAIAVVGSTPANGGDMNIRWYTRNGALDTSRGTSGVTTWDSGSGNDVAYATAYGAESAVFVAGRTAANSGDAMIRALDFSTGADTGQFYTWNSGSGDDYVVDMAVDSPDTATSISTRIPTLMRSAANSGEWRYAELTVSGTETSGFTYDGNSSYDDPPKGLCRSPMSGHTYAVGGKGAAVGQDWMIRRVADGASTWDATWPNPTYTSGAGSDFDQAIACAVSLQGNLYVVGRKGGGFGDIAVRSYDSSGNLRTNWGSSGMYTWDSGGGGVDQAVGVTVQGETLFVTVHSNAADWKILRLGADGALDTNWGTSGIVTYDSGSGNDVPSGMMSTLETDDLIVYGSAATNSGDWMIRKYNANGDLINATSAFNSRITLGDGYTSNSMVFNRNFTVGKSSDTVTAIVDNVRGDLPLDIGGSLVMENHGRLYASDTSRFEVSKDLDFRSGTTFTAGSGTVTLSDAEEQSEITSQGQSFNNLTIEGFRKAVMFKNSTTTTISGTFTSAGSSCTAMNRIGSDSGGTAATINSGTEALSYTQFKDITASPAFTTTSSEDISGNTGITFNSPCSDTTPKKPTNMYADDSNAQSGSQHAAGLTSATPKFSWISRIGGPFDKQRVQVVNDVIGFSPGTWHLDGNGTDSSATSNAMTLPGGGADPSWVTGNTNFSQAASFDGVNDYLSASSNAAYDLDEFTVSAWVNFDAADAGTGTYPTIVQRQSSDTNSNFAIRINPGALTVEATLSAGGVQYKTNDLYSSLLTGDRRWHHFAMTVKSGQIGMYLDGSLISTKTFSGNVDNPASAIRIGDGFKGQIDDVQLVNYAQSADEILGYARTSLPHDTTLWDSDNTDAGVAMTSCTSGSRCADITYGGAAGTLRSDGARYYVRAKFKNTGGPTWSHWSTYDWFTTASSMTVSVTSGSSETLQPSPALPGDDATATSDITVNTSSSTGYQLLAGVPDPARVLRSGDSVIPTWTAITYPTTWTRGVSGYAGMTVLAATGGKDTAKWGTGTTERDFENLKYSGMTPYLNSMHARKGYSASTDTITVGYRVNAPPSAPRGVYTGTVTFTAVANP